ncbi:Septum site-determining protein MinC [uncultured Clostridium sp.]|jgi:septum site-determining protein MinC|nr:Septum site-determining protein MinC [uncultured Clostridium sp.]
MVYMDRLVSIKSSRYGMEIHLDPKAPFGELMRALTLKLKNSTRFFEGAHMALSLVGRSLSKEEEQNVLEQISALTGIEIVCIIEQDKQKDQMYKSIVEQTLSNIYKKDGQFYRGTLSKRQVLESDSSIVILGDVESGARVIAKGNVVVVGGLSGTVKAGASGDRNAFVAALSMQPKQLCIGEIEANCQRFHKENLSINGPKIAFIDGNHIYLDPLVE